MENILGGVVAVIIVVLLIGWAVAAAGKAVNGAATHLSATVGNKSPSRSSQYSDDSDARLQRASELMKQRMTCAYCGEMNMPGMTCANCGAKKPAA